MNEKVEKFINDLKQLNIQLLELREYFWLDIDRSSESDRQRGIMFDNKFEKIKDIFQRTEKTVGNFLEDSFYNPKEETRKEALKRLSAEFANFNDWNEDVKNTLIEKNPNDILKEKSKLTDNDEGNSRRKAFDELQSVTIKRVISRSKPSRLFICFPDGTEICEPYAARTLIETIKKIGVEKVLEVNLEVTDIRYISKDKNNLRRPVFLENGYYLETNTDTQFKKKQLEAISQALNLGLKVKMIDR